MTCIHGTPGADFCRDCAGMDEEEYDKQLEIERMAGAMHSLLAWSASLGEVQPLKAAWMAGYTAWRIQSGVLTSNDELAGT